MHSIVKLNKDDQQPTCLICVYSKEMVGLKELSCSKKGIVRTTDACKKFSLNILAKTSKRKHSLDNKNYNDSDFSIY